MYIHNVPNQVLNLLCKYWTFLHILYLYIFRNIIENIEKNATHYISILRSELKSELNMVNLFKTLDAV